PRLAGVVSRGGSFLAKWIQATKKENPLYENFDRLLKIARKYDVVLSLGDGLRPGAIADSTDRAQIQELIILGELTKTALENGVSIIIEGPGHIPINQIQTNIKLQKDLCGDVPFYVLGPIVTDIAPGYDHITAAIGGALAAYFGADFLCYVTPAEHLGLPSLDDVREGIIASKIAAHAANITRNKKYQAWDDAMSSARKNLDWEKQISLSINPYYFFNGKIFTT
ncbi:phosphomethylpyrimidine synthase, partial [Candidatus Magnetomorum sp. HK-1]